MWPGRTTCKCLGVGVGVGAISQRPGFGVVVGGTLCKSRLRLPYVPDVGAVCDSGSPAAAPRTPPPPRPASPRPPVPQPSPRAPAARGPGA